MDTGKREPIGDEFHIDFSTEDGPGLLATKVILTSEYIQDLSATVRCDLVDHPLYANLERYVLANPSRGRKPL